MSKKYLKGFSKLGYIPVTANTDTAYTAAGERVLLAGAQSCAPTDNKTAFSIQADDGVYDSGSEWTSSTLVITVAEMSLSDLAALGGAGFTEADELMEEGSFDAPPENALTFAALRADGGYRMYRYYAAKCTGYKVTHNTKGQSSDPQTYELTFEATPRKIDGMIRGTSDAAVGDALTWLESVPSLPKTESQG